MRESINNESIKRQNKETNTDSPLLSREELLTSLKNLKSVYKELYKDLEAGMPQGILIGDQDMRGLSIEAILNYLKKIAEDTYESPHQQNKGTQTESLTQEVIPKWLVGNENLIWKGSSDDPLWLPSYEQHKDQVRISFVRRNTILHPGKDKTEQEISLLPVKDTFNLTEYRVLKVIFDKYISLEEQLRDKDPEVRKRAKENIFTILSEEQAARHGRLEETPKIITYEIEKILEDLTKKTRGFDRSKIDVHSLSQSAAELLSQLFILNRTRGNRKEHMLSEKRMSGIQEYPSFEHYLEKLSKSAAQQLNDKQGITYMLGEAGTGKNILAEYFAYKTNRPFFWFPCGRGMESMELVYHYEFDSEEGTQKFFTDLAQGIQTPGAVVLIDEVNALRPEVQAILHGLGDKNRSIKYNGVNIPVAEGVILIIASNPASYSSGGNIGEALLNRTRGLSFTVDYPALHKGELLAIDENWDDVTLRQKEQEDNSLREYACDEVLLLYKKIPQFQNLSTEEFEILWENVINEHQEYLWTLEKNPNTSYLLKDKNIVKILNDIKNLLEVADRWRKYYSKKERGFNIVGFSIRDSLAVLQKYIQTGDIKTAFLEVYDDFRKNPIDGLDVQYYGLLDVLNEVGIG